MNQPSRNIPRRCQTCRSPLPESAHPTRRYCSTACRKKAYRRRAQGAPLSDPAQTPEEASALTAEADRLARENARLRKLVTRIHATRQKWQTKAATADDRIAAKQRKSERKELAAAGRVAGAQRKPWPRWKSSRTGSWSWRHRLPPRRKTVGNATWPMPPPGN